MTWWEGPRAGKSTGTWTVSVLTHAGVKRRRTMGEKSKWHAVSQIVLQGDTFHLSTFPRHEISCSTDPQCSWHPMLLGSHQPAQPRAKEKSSALLIHWWECHMAEMGTGRYWMNLTRKARDWSSYPNAILTLHCTPFIHLFILRIIQKRWFLWGYFQERQSSDDARKYWSVFTICFPGLAPELSKDTPYKFTAGWMAEQGSSGGQGHVLQSFILVSELGVHWRNQNTVVRQPKPEPQCRVFMVMVIFGLHYTSAKKQHPVIARIFNKHVSMKAKALLK